MNKEQAIEAIRQMLNEEKARRKEQYNKPVLLGVAQQAVYDAYRSHGYTDALLDVISMLESM